MWAITKVQQEILQESFFIYLFITLLRFLEIFDDLKLMCDGFLYP